MCSATYAAVLRPYSLSMRLSAWSSARFRVTSQVAGTVAKNFLSFWAHEDLGIAIEPGVDELSLALTAEPFSWTHRSQVYSVARSSQPVRTLRGLTILPDRVEDPASRLRMLPPPDANQPLRALDQALKRIESEYGRGTAAYVALHMEYPGY